MASNAETEAAGRRRTRVRPYHHGNLRAALLAAAVDAINERGVGDLKLRDLARRVGVSHGAPANHFRDRTALLRALAIEGFEILLERQTQALAEAPYAAPHERLNAIGVAYVAFSVDNRAHFEVMFQRELLTDPEVLGAAARSFEVVMSTIGHVRVESRATAGDDLLGALGAWALVHGISTLHTHGLLPSAICNDAPRLTTEILAAMSRLATSASVRSRPPR